MYNWGMRNTYKCDFLVAGAGISGICAAVQAGRLGLDTVIIEKEMTLGGNAGPLFGVGPSGAHVNNEFYTETGIVLELEERLNKAGARPAQNYMAINTSTLWDRVVSDMLKEAGVRIFRKHLVASVKTDKCRIESVGVINIENLDEIEFIVNGYALDSTGDAHLAVLSGADITMGRESRAKTGERSAPEKADRTISAASLMAVTVDTGIKNDFTPPEGTPEWNPSKPANTFDPSKKYNYIFQVDEGGEETGLNSMDTPQALYESLVERIYSIWDYFKNTKYKGKADTHELIWISSVLGRRESRRIIGDYMLTQTDIESNKDFEDAVGFGGFYLDYHPPSHDGGYETVFYYNPLPYQIPLRCLYSRNIRNLFSGGRAISATHIAFTSTRVMRTGGLLGQSTAAAAYLCLKHGKSPLEISTHHMDELHILLKKQDVFIPGVSTKDPDNLVNIASVSATGTAGFESYENPIDPKWTGKNCETRLYCYPDKIDGIMFYARNKKNRAGRLSLELAFGKTKGFTAYEHAKKNTNYSFHYPERENDVSSLTSFYKKSMTIPAHYQGWVVFSCALDNLEQPDRKTVRKCMSIKISGNTEYAVNSESPDFMEGNIIPIIRFEPVFDYGSPSNIKDGSIHREGIGLLHKWTINPYNKPQSLMLDFENEVEFSIIELVFDTTEKTEAEMFYCKGTEPPEKLVREFSVEIVSNGTCREIFKEGNNWHRYIKIKFDDKQKADQVKINVLSIASDRAEAGIYEVRIY